MALRPLIPAHRKVSLEAGISVGVIYIYRRQALFLPYIVRSYSGHGGGSTHHFVAQH